MHRDAIDDILVDYDYVFDLADQLTSEAHHGQTATYTHDDAGQLTDADHSSLSDEVYSYDLNGNRTLSGYVIGAGNRVLSDGTFDYTYDGEGNLLTKTEIATGTVTSFGYDHRNRLVAVEVRNSANTLLQSLEYVYDIFNRRITKSVDADGAGVSVAVATHFVYDGEHVWADYDGTGVVLARYLFGDRTDEILARYHPGEGTDWYLTDHLGTVRDQVDDAGGVINHLDYDSFGNIVAQSNAVVGDRYTFTGREFDIETGLFYYRARYYDAQLGRFISQDPISFAAGDVNLYRYVSNEVVSSTDPSGLMTLTEYGKKLWAGPVGTLLRNAQFQCFSWTIVGYGAGKVISSKITGQYEPIKAQEVGSLALGGISCTMFATSASAQATFLALTEIFYLHAIGASATDIAVAGVMHTFGVAGGNGSLSQYVGQVWGRLNANNRIGHSIGELIGGEAGTFNVGAAVNAAKQLLGKQNQAFPGMTPDQQALKELVDEATRGGRVPLSVGEAETVLDWAQALQYPGWRAKAGDVASPSNWTANPVPHIHIPGAGRNGHIPVQAGVTPRP